MRSSTPMASSFLSPWLDACACAAALCWFEAPAWCRILNLLASCWFAKVLLFGKFAFEATVLPMGTACWPASLLPEALRWSFTQAKSVPSYLMLRSLLCLLFLAAATWAVEQEEFNVDCFSKSRTS